MLQKVDVLIIGQGICGTFLSLELERAGLSYLIIDEVRPFSASKTAAGLINPVTGRRLVTTWMIDELLPFARQSYGQLAALLGSNFLEKLEVIDFFPTVQMRQAFLRRMEEDDSYLRLPANEQNWASSFKYELGYGIISPVYLVDMPGLLSAMRKRMQEQGVLRDQRFEPGKLEIAVSAPGKVRYEDIEANRIIFCDGISSYNSSYFSRLPFAPNKGEVLIVDIPGLEERTIFKKGISVAPWLEGLYWVGSSYEWSFETAEPTQQFRQKTEGALKEWVRLPFRVVDHLAAIRPATLERRPFVGFHPLYPAVGILNGMGTKGCSLAPWFARQLVDHLIKGSPIQPDADILRFTKLLSRG